MHHGSSGLLSLQEAPVAPSRGNSLLADVAPERSSSVLQCVLVHGEDGEQHTPPQVKVDKEVGNSIDFATRVDHLAQDEEDVHVRLQPGFSASL